MLKDVLQKYQGKKVFITGHTGFKGTWMTQMLLMAGAEVTGYALEPPTKPSLFELCRPETEIHSVRGDIRDLQQLQRVFEEAQPEIVIHMAAQPIVRESYRNPVYTYETNVMGTVNVLECVRRAESVKSVVNVTTDKVYKNREWEWGYRENEELGGFDPYSNSKACSELVTDSYKNAFLQDRDIAVSTCRAGNVIGGGDFAADRIIPDCIRAAERRENIVVRNPHSTRPYQHVLEPVGVYLMLAMKQYEDSKYAGNYNVGPDDTDCWTTGDVVTEFCRQWNELMGEKLEWVNQYDGGPHEANYLKLDCSKLKKTFDWRPVWNVKTAIQKVVEFEQARMTERDIQSCVRGQIKEYLSAEGNG